MKRRTFLTSIGVGAAFSACGDGGQVAASSATTSGGVGGDGGGIGSGGHGGASTSSGNTTSSGPLTCTPSDDNILGPYYRPGAPFRTDLTDNATLGTRVTVSGTVVDLQCQPIAGALVDVWQADHSGDYDNDGVDDPPKTEFVLRARLNSGADGAYSFLTVHPGQYLNGAQYRPAHIHVTVSAPGFTSLTTQLYFEGDPYNDIDPFIQQSLIMPVVVDGEQERCAFDFVLSPS